VCRCRCLHPQEEDDGEEAEAAYVEVDIEDVKRRMQGAVDALHREFTAISAGRATPTMLDGIMVAGEGGAVALPTLAKVLLHGPQGLQVIGLEPNPTPNPTPKPEPDPKPRPHPHPNPHPHQVSVFEPAMVAAVCKAIEEAEMGFVPEVQGKMLKVTVPRMTTEARELLVKQARKLGEASKTSVRNVRQAAMKRAKGHPSKEERKRAEKEVEAAP
jgi:ribosome recycling factor